jgi:hypothetical protein
MTRIEVGFPSMAGIEIYAVSGRCEWWGLVDGVVVVAEWVGPGREILRGIFRPMTPLW